MKVGEIILNLPYPRKIWFLSYFKKREIGFAFNNRALLNLIENNDIDLPSYKKWMQDVGNNIAIMELIYAAAQSYCYIHGVKVNFNKEGLAKSLMEAGNDAMKLIMKAWRDSEELGFRKIPTKKKAKMKR